MITRQNVVSVLSDVLWFKPTLPWRARHSYERRSLESAYTVVRTIARESALWQVRSS
jgi:hypothetical protein